MDRKFSTLRKKKGTPIESRVDAHALEEVLDLFPEEDYDLIVYALSLCENSVDDAVDLLLSMASEEKLQTKLRHPSNPFVAMSAAGSTGSLIAMPTAVAAAVAAKKKEKAEPEYDVRVGAAAAASGGESLFS
jgi:hypothetical protein